MPENSWSCPSPRVGAVCLANEKIRWGKIGSTSAFELSTIT